MSVPSKAPKKETGWDKLRQENEQNYTPDFRPIRGVIRRNEFLGSIVELFVSAVVGVSKLNLGAQEPPTEEKTDLLK